MQKPCSGSTNCPQGPGRGGGEGRGKKESESKDGCLNGPTQERWNLTGVGMGERVADEVREGFICRRSYGPLLGHFQDPMGKTKDCSTIIAYLRDKIKNGRGVKNLEMGNVLHLEDRSSWSL